MPLLEVRGVSKRFPTVQALQDVSFSLERGETLAVVGGSGSGKSTLARLLCRLLEPDAGDIAWEGRSIRTFDRRAWARHVQMVFQDPYASLNPKLSVGLQLDEALRMAGARRGGVGEALAGVGLSPAMSTRYPFQFSGGQRQRIAIARALALQPQLLVLDEPLSALDGETQTQILDLFKAVHRAQNIAFLLITHDLGLAAQFAQRVIVLQSGRLVEEGPAARVLSAPQHAYTRALVDAVIA